ncbi:hypothetical protein CBER1_08033 [Cercospora berteroae]|uniref:NmrA-like domain-containing protein n=1 Tax=Cercospora berteroae TaxID=357750 RepID=A0A2S6C6V5_9PEZI|nr:hypothetical protein CBER1_08033 [Cercospora berteroae]
MAPLQIGLLGATGETGSSIFNGLISSPQASDFHVTALVRPSSLSKPANQALKSHKNVSLRALDLTASHEEITSSLQGIEILISAIGAQEQLSQIQLATAAKAAGVKRFLPCAFITVIPSGGTHLLRD